MATRQRPESDSNKTGSSSPSKESTFSGKKGGLGMGRYVGHGYTQRDRTGASRAVSGSSGRGSNPGNSANLNASGSLLGSRSSSGKSGSWSADPNRSSSSRGPQRSSSGSSASRSYSGKSGSWSAPSSSSTASGKAVPPSARPDSPANRSQASRSGSWQKAPSPARSGKIPAVASPGGPGKGGKPPKKRKKGRKGKLSPGKVAVIAVLVFLALFFGVDLIVNNGKVHTGVSVGGIDVGGMTKEEAAQAIEDAYASKVGQSSITMYASPDAEQIYGIQLAENRKAQAAADATGEEQAPSAMGALEIEPVEITFDYDVLERFNTDPPRGPVFVVSPETLGARIDGQALAEKAYSVGRGADFIPGRLRAGTVGTPLDIEVSVEPTSVDALAGILTNALGVPMESPAITFAEGAFSPVEGRDGYMVKYDEFSKLIADTLLSDPDEEGMRSFIIPMDNVAMTGSMDSAKRAAEAAQDAVSKPVELVYADQSWMLDANVLGPLVHTFVDGGRVVPYVSLGSVENAIPALGGIGNIGTPAHNVRFSYNGTDLVYTEASDGIGPDYTVITQQLNEILFGDATLSQRAGEASEELKDEQEQQADVDARRITMVLTASYPTMTFEDAQGLGLNASLIRSYTTDYSNANDEKITNIRLLSDILSNTVIAPGETFSINDVAGECNAEKGFQEAGSILDGEVTSEIGGGICQVATTIFNAVLEAGYPIVERHNHSNYMASYPDGQDAAISWPYLDLKFKNDTANHLLLLMDYDDTSVTCSLWGISPERYGETEIIEWDEGDTYTTKLVVDPELDQGTEYVRADGQNGHTTVLERKIYSTDGTLLGEDAFTSVYQPKKRVIVVGPNTTSTLIYEQNEG